MKKVSALAEIQRRKNTSLEKWRICEGVNKVLFFCDELHKLNLIEVLQYKHREN